MPKLFTRKPKLKLFFGLRKKSKKTQNSETAIKASEAAMEKMIDVMIAKGILAPSFNAKREDYLFDFRARYLTMEERRLNEISFNEANLTGEPQPNKEKRNPKCVLNELEIESSPVTLTNLDEKISIIRKKLNLSINTLQKQELERMLQCLENRKFYEKYQAFFEKFPNTTEEKIANFIEKYPHLTIQTADIFVPEFPKEAIQVMDLYTEKVKELCALQPVFYVIAKHEDFNVRYKKRDPILLVQSPFGVYWQILGAWDEEMVLLSEL